MSKTPDPYAARAAAEAIPGLCAPRVLRGAKFGRVLLSSGFAESWHQKVGTAMYIRLASIAIFAVFLSGLPVKAQSFNRQDLDCAVAATLEEGRADKGATADNNFHEMIIFFVRRLIVHDDQTNWARVVYDRSHLSPRRAPVAFLAKCTELYQSSLHQ
jgi:hypothetical protein